MGESRQGIRKRITTLAITIGLVVFLCSVGLAIFEVQSNLMQASESKIDEITELGLNVVKGYQERVKTGELTEGKAKELALKDLKNFRYQGKNYVWVNGYDNLFLEHATQAKGVDSSKIADKNGVKFFYELTQLAKSGEHGYIKYHWTKAGDTSGKIYPKISTSKSVPEWQWVIATGIYVDEINRIILKTFFEMFLLNFIVLSAIILLISLTFIKKLVTELQTITDDLEGNSSNVAYAATSLDSASHRLAEGSTEQAASIQETSSTLEETSSMVFRNTENTSEAATLARQTKTSAHQGNEKMQQMMQAMLQIKDSSNEISKIVKTIDEISFQTNILALNAAVEAARAGDAGKGFAVVAEEVRNLAQRSANAAKDTTSLINKNIELSANGTNIAEDVNHSISDIDLQINKVSDLLEEIAVATKEQSTGIDQINKAVSQMETVLQTNAQTAEQSASASQELTAQSQTMSGIVTRLTTIVKGND